LLGRSGCSLRQQSTLRRESQTGRVIIQNLNKLIIDVTQGHEELFRTSGAFSLWSICKKRRLTFYRAGLASEKFSLSPLFRCF
jgi:hypothetical protein